MFSILSCYTDHWKPLFWLERRFWILLKCWVKPQCRDLSVLILNLRNIVHKIPHRHSWWWDYCGFTLHKPAKRVHLNFVLVARSGVSCSQLHLCKAPTECLECPAYIEHYSELLCTSLLQLIPADLDHCRRRFWSGLLHCSSRCWTCWRLCPAILCQPICRLQQLCIMCSACAASQSLQLVPLALWQGAHCLDSWAWTLKTQSFKFGSSTYPRSQQPLQGKRTDLIPWEGGGFSKMIVVFASSYLAFHACGIKSPTGEGLQRESYLHRVFLKEAPQQWGTDKKLLRVAGLIFPDAIWHDM